MKARRCCLQGSNAHGIVCRNRIPPLDVRPRHVCHAVLKGEHSVSASFSLWPLDETQHLPNVLSVSSLLRRILCVSVVVTRQTETSLIHLDGVGIRVFRVGSNIHTEGRITQIEWMSTDKGRKRALILNTLDALEVWQKWTNVECLHSSLIHERSVHFANFGPKMHLTLEELVHMKLRLVTQSIKSANGCLVIRDRQSCDEIPIRISKEIISWRNGEVLSVGVEAIISKGCRGGLRSAQEPFGVRFSLEARHHPQRQKKFNGHCHRETRHD
mmetsp:Transcript_53716/g.143700  ORF Transcript_53716/g.143700 Transcript_53716/m.143700 type:complete len:271 (+) Transcript_53716:1270-2082(+)